MLIFPEHVVTASMWQKEAELVYAALVAVKSLCRTEYESTFDDLAKTFEEAGVQRVAMRLEDPGARR
jgi:hypothetical protein